MALYECWARWKPCLEDRVEKLTFLLAEDAEYLQHWQRMVLVAKFCRRSSNAASSFVQQTHTASQ